MAGDSIGDVGLLTVAIVIIGTVIMSKSKSSVSKKEVVKQGSYGKVIIHKDSLIRQLLRPSEVMAMIRCKMMKKNGKTTSGLAYGAESLGNSAEDIKFCEEKLAQVSRSFALVITFLPNSAEAPLRLGVAIFYLVLRALDTVEDDMNLEKFKPFVSPEEKCSGGKYLLRTKENLLRTFHERFDDQKRSKRVKISGLGEGHELELLDNYDIIVRVFETLPAAMREVICDITNEMGNGMADYVARDLRNGTVDDADFSKYCHIVAGTVGDGLTRLFAASGLESSDLVKKVNLWDSMGELLQRTNIIRDYLEDFEDGRAFWPESVWKVYTEKEDLGELRLSRFIDSGKSVACLNHMIADALELVPAVLEYLENIHEPSILSFCALPQVMAISTLGKCYNNKDVFTGVVKLRKGLSAKILLAFAPTNTPFTEDKLRASYKLWFLREVMDIQKTAKAIQKNDPTSSRVIASAEKIKTCLSR